MTRRNRSNRNRKVTEILCSFRLVLDGKTGKEIPESLWLEFSEKFLAKNFALSDAEDNTSGSLSSGGISDLQLAKSPENQVSGTRWTLLVAYPSLAASRSLLKLSVEKPF